MYLVLPHITRREQSTPSESEALSSQLSALPVCVSLSLSLADQLRDRLPDVPAVGEERSLGINGFGGATILPVLV